MPVYLVRAGERGPVKIGFAEDVAGRLIKMQCDNHERLIVLRVLRGAFKEEGELHRRFSELRLHGEWFAFSRQMLGDLGLEDVARAEPSSAEAPLDKIIDDLGGEAAVAVACECGPSAISNWKKRGIPRARWVDLVTMAKRLGKKLTLEDVAAANSLIVRPDQWESSSASEAA